MVITETKLKRWDSVPFTNVKIWDKFWRPKLEQIRRVTVPLALERCEKASRDGLVPNLAAWPATEFPGTSGRDDSGVCKAIEGAAYTLMLQRDAELESRLDTLIDEIVAAREGGGTYTEDAVGSWIEAAVAYCEVTGKRTLLDAVCRWADRAEAQPDRGRWQGSAGRAETKEDADLDAGIGIEDIRSRVEQDVGSGIEQDMTRDMEPDVRSGMELALALMKLHGLTGEHRYRTTALDLFEQGIQVLGQGERPDDSEWEEVYGRDDVLGRVTKCLEERLNERGKDGREGFREDFEDSGEDLRKEYRQARREQDLKDRGVHDSYVYAAMADLARIAGDSVCVDMLKRAWSDRERRHGSGTYGAFGIYRTAASRQDPDFAPDGELSDESERCETCAAIGMAIWSQRMNLLLGEGRYADRVEQELYNGALAGLSLSGDRFCAADRPAFSDGPQRVERFDEACCWADPVRFLPGIGQYAYAKSEDGIAINQYIGGKADLTTGGGHKVEITQVTRYPWDGTIDLGIGPAQTCEFTLRLRLPGWCRSYRLWVCGQESGAAVQDGYLELRRVWRPGDQVRLVLDMPAEAVRAHSQAEDGTGRIALRRGPIVYALEEADHPGLDGDAFALAPGRAVRVLHDPDLLGGVTLLEFGRAGSGEHCGRFIPYYARDNREPGFVRVWVKEDPAEGPYRF